MLLFLLSLFAGDQTISGIVNDANGKPVAGALVGVSSYSGEATPTAITDTNGRYSLTKPLSIQSEFDGGGVIAFHPDHGLALWALRTGESEGIILRLARSDGFRVVVQDADGKPAHGVRVAAVTLRPDRSPVRIPPPIVDRLAVTTNAEGVAKFSNLEGKHVTLIRVEAATKPTQSFQVVKEAHEWGTIRLQPTMTIKGRFTGVAWPKGAEATVDSYLATGTELAIVMEAKVRPADDGSFSAVVIANGFWGVKISTDVVSLRNLRDRTKATVDAPEKLFALAATVPIAGVVRADDGSPVAGARVGLFSATLGGGQFVTDTEGRYSGRVAVGKLNRSVTPPPGYTSDRARRESVEIGKTVELTPITVARTLSISGIVKDESGKPAPGIRVMAVCSVSAGGGMTEYYPRYGTSGSDGTFIITGIPKGASVTLRALREARGVYSNTVQTEPAKTGVEMKLDPSLAAPLAVVAHDESDRPIGKVEYRLEYQERYANDSSWLDWLRQDFQRPILGSEAKPTPLGNVPKSLKFKVAATAEGYLPGESAWTPGESLKAPIVVKLRRALESTGRVVDSAGGPIAGAIVKPAGAYGSESTTRTDSEGRFKLSGVPFSTAVLTAHGDGFRYGGGIVKVGEPATITLKRANEPAPRSMASAFPGALAETSKKLLDPLADAVFSGKGEMKTWWAQSYAYQDPTRFLDLINGPQWTDEDRDFARHHLAAALAPIDADEAIAQAQAIKASDRKAGALLEVARHLPAAAKSRRLTLLADALTAARGGADPSRKALYIAKVGEALFHEGDSNGEKAIREAEELAKKLGRDGWPAYAIGTVAESLSLIDFKAAMELTKDLPGSKEDLSRGPAGGDSYTFNRHRGNIAHQIAGRQPENAEKAFDSMTESGNRSRYASRVCYRMAPVDLARAKRVATRAGAGADKAVCLASMAMALGPKRRAEALPLLQQAFAELSAEKMPRYNGYGNAPLGMAIVYIAATVAPDEADDFFWQALALPGPQRPTARGSFGRDGRVGAVATSALLAQRFDAEVARTLAASLKERAAALFDEVKNERTQSDDAMAAVAAILALCPGAALELLKNWPAPTAEGPSDRANYARLIIGSFLRASPQKLNDRIMDRYLHQWYIDKEDL